MKLAGRLPASEAGSLPPQSFPSLARLNSLRWKSIIVGADGRVDGGDLAARANLNPLVLEAPSRRTTFHHYLVRIFPDHDGIDGPQLIRNAARSEIGARFFYAEATGFEPLNSHIRLQVDDKEGWRPNHSLSQARSGALVGLRTRKTHWP